jgi:competence protein ComEA
MSSGARWGASPGANPGPGILNPGIGNVSGVFRPRTPTGVPNHHETGDFMRKKWIPLAVALALLAGAAQADAAATENAKATPVPSASAAQGKAPAAKPPATAKKKLVNLNAASRAELKGLPGGSDEEAGRIIAGRPYNSKAFLLTNQVISAGRYEEIKALVVAGKTTKPAASRK